MIINKDCKHIECDKIYKNDELKEKLSQEMYSQLIKFLGKKYFDGLFFYNGELYYRKNATNSDILKELIGCFLGEKLNLNTVNYQICFYDNKPSIASKIFYEPNHSYLTCKEYFGYNARKILELNPPTYSSFILNEVSMLKKLKNSNMITNILKLTALDLKMGQFDRHNYNLLLDITVDSIDLAPIFDFANSYINMFVYENPFLIINKNHLSLEALCHGYPRIIPYLNELANIEIIDILKDIEKSFGVTIHKNDFYEYQKQDDEFKRILKK